MTDLSLGMLHGHDTELFPAGLDISHRRNVSCVQRFLRVPHPTNAHRPSTHAN